MKAWFVGSALLWLACAAHAQGTVKCQDKNGRIAYVDRDCAVYGLQEIGPVKDRIPVAAASPSSEAQEAAAPDGARACNTDAEKFWSQGGGIVVDCVHGSKTEITEA